jgi:large subunit ribosomal protein L25
MADQLVVKAVKREAQGSGEARRIRSAGQIPAVVYGDGDPQNIKLNGHDFEMLLRDHGQNFVADLDIEGEKSARKVLLKDVQHDPRRGDITHADFIGISMTQVLQVSLPLELLGEPAGAVEGGMLEQLVSEIEVECLPGDMVESITVDVSALAIGDHLTVGDLTLPAGLKAVTEAEVAIASVAAPRVEEEPKAEGEEGAEGVEGEAAGEATAEESEA